MKTLMFLLVSLVAITATAQVRSAAAAARKQIANGGSVLVRG